MKIGKRKILLAKRNIVMYVCDCEMTSCNKGSCSSSVFLCPNNPYLHVCRRALQAEARHALRPAEKGGKVGSKFEPNYNAAGGARFLRHPVHSTAGDGPSKSLKFYKLKVPLLLSHY